MFLKNLKQDEKESFLSLVYQIANVDGNYGGGEKNIIENYKLELGLNMIKEDKNITELVSFFASKELSVKKIVLFEVYSLIISDDELDRNEVSTLSLLENKLDIAPNVVQEIENVVEELSDVYNKIYDILA